MKRNKAYIALKPSTAPASDIEIKIYVCKLREHFVPESLIIYRFLILALIKKAQFKKDIIYTFLSSSIREEKNMSSCFGKKYGFCKYFAIFCKHFSIFCDQI